VLSHSLQLYDWCSLCAATFTATVRLVQRVCFHIHCNCTIGAVCVLPHSLQLYDWCSVCAATFTATIRLVQCVCCHIHCNCTICAVRVCCHIHCNCTVCAVCVLPHSLQLLRFSSVRTNKRNTTVTFCAKSDGTAGKSFLSTRPAVLSAVGALLIKPRASSDRYNGEMHKKKNPETKHKKKMNV
jgi:hypothetical protein